MLHWMATAPQYDGLYFSRYTQMWCSTASNDVYDQHYYTTGQTTRGGEEWRDVYWSLGQNLIDMMTKAEAEQRWDLLGVGYILKAWGWMALTDLHGEIIIKEAFDPTRTAFDYDTQEYAYSEVNRLLNLAITNLSRTDGAVDANFLGKTDLYYNYKGDRTKWLKFAYGMLAMSLNHLSNKSTYNPAAVIAAVDKSFTGNVDDALLPYTGVANDDKNFEGNTRNNLGSIRQTAFIVNLLNGAQFGGVVDPRLSRMLVPSTDGIYRGLTPTAGATFTGTQAVPTIWGTAAVPPTGTLVRYIFDDKQKFPVMTYAQLQFIKAEAAYKMNNKDLALSAYTNGVSAHIDFVNSRNQDNAQVPTQITATEKASFLANPAIIPTVAANLTLSQIMCQKYIAQWGWAHNETWVDMRRYHYTDLDPVTGKQVYLGFTLPVVYSDNAGKPAYRLRPLYASEYVWNVAALQAIGALAIDYHTKMTWIAQP